MHIELLSGRFKVIEQYTIQDKQFSITRRLPDVSAVDH